jgi:hypothetical protein
MLELSERAKEGEKLAIGGHHFDPGLVPHDVCSEARAIFLGDREGARFRRRFMGGGISKVALPGNRDLDAVSVVYFKF